MRIFKRKCTKPLPVNAEPFEPGKGKRCVRYVDGRGHNRTARLTQNGSRIVVETKCWHIEFEDSLGIRRHIEGYTDQEATQRLADQIQKLLNCKARGDEVSTELRTFFGNIPKRIKEDLTNFGLWDARPIAASFTLESLIDSFRTYLASRERCGKHVKGTRSLLKKLFASCGFVKWGDISAHIVKDMLDKRRNAGLGISKVTYNRYLGSVKHFCKWAAQELNTVSPVEYIKGLDNEQTDRRHIRRAASPRELRQLFQSVVSGPERQGMRGSERYLLYWFATETGLRANEIRNLKINSFDFDDLTVVVEAAYSKHRRRDIVPLRPKFAAALREFLADKPPVAKAFGGTYVQLTDHTSELLRDDLNDAGLPYIDDSGAVFDFHAFRHTFITNLRNVSPRIAQSLARHQSSAMTDHYTHTWLFDGRGALETLPDLSLPSVESQKSVKTGTDDRDVTGESLSKVYFQDGQVRTLVQISGQKNGDIEGKTQFCFENEGSVQTLNQMVAGSIPASPIWQVPERQKVMKSKPTNESDNCRKFIEKRLSKQEPDPDLELLVERWPQLSDEVRRIIGNIVATNQ